ncbi:MAG TPA: hypothetical protein VGJ73_12775 [Verrucomicrobiae bacterium]|jgi:hypothetical protein
MPLKIGDKNSSRSLVGYEQYKNKTTNTDEDTRVDQTAMEWVISVTSDVTYCVKFSGNFHKKHLYTSTKKLANVQLEYDKLGSITNDDARWQAAQDAADEEKFKRQLGHRSRGEQDCVTCGHSIKEHTDPGMACGRVTKSIGPTGAMKNGKPVRGEISTPCTCKKYDPKYQQDRVAQGKPTVNPLEGATAQSNDAIWMDKIPRATFEQTIVKAIQTRQSELKLKSESWGADQHIEWDFGASNRGCILKLDDKTSLADARSKGHRSVEVLMKLDNTDAKRPIFTACHLDGKKTK